MSDLISREKAFDMLSEYYHHRLDSQHLALREALSRVPSAELETIVRCKDCKHRPIDTGGDNDPEDLDFPDERCPCRCMDDFYSWMPEDDWFCANGE